MLCYFDLEANGLLDTVTKIHCGVFIEAASEQAPEVFGDYDDYYLKGVIKNV